MSFGLRFVRVAVTMPVPAEACRLLSSSAGARIKSLTRRISGQIGWLTQNSERAVSQLIRAMVRAMVWTRQRTVPRPV